MIIESIELKNFRNYENLCLKFDSGINIFYGDNAQGKTNILESVYVGSTTKSHKRSKDREMIQFGEDESHIRSVLKKGDMTYRIDMHLRNNKTKAVAVNGVPIHKAAELLGIVNVIFFSPEDLSIIKSSPQIRRRFIDAELCQLDKMYLHNLANYNKVLDKRNHLLKEIGIKPSLKDTLFIWDEQLLKYGREIIERRKMFIEEINEIVQDIHRKLSGGKEELFIKYVPSVESDDFEEGILKGRENDIFRKMTLLGPHRDDLCFYINDVNIHKFGSQGQQRTSALSLKMAEIELVNKKIKDTPILLLDDVLSELDSSRQNQLLDSIHQVQTLITCTGLDEFVNNRFKIDKIFRVMNGTVYIEN